MGNGHQREETTNPTYATDATSPPQDRAYLADKIHKIPSNGSGQRQCPRQIQGLIAAEQRGVEERREGMRIEEPAGPFRQTALPGRESNPRPRGSEG